MNLSDIPRLPPPQTRLPLVVLHHFDISTPHYDLLLQLPTQPLLLAWRVSTPPDHWLTLHKNTLNPLRNFDHRPLYLTYEGPLTSNRGSVKRLLTTTALLLSLDTSALTLSLVLPDFHNLTLHLPLRQSPG